MQFGELEDAVALRRLRNLVIGALKDRKPWLTVSQSRYIFSPVLEIADMAAPSSMLHIRVDDKTKAQATEALNAIGLSMSDAVRIFLRRVVAEQAFPLELKVPNAETRAAMAEADEMIRARRARFATADELFADLEKNSGK